MKILALTKSRINGKVKGAVITDTDGVIQIHRFIGSIPDFLKGAK